MSKYTPLKDIPEKLGIKKNTNLFISSDTTQLLWKCFENEGTNDLNQLLDSLQGQTGTGGTIVIPTYNWDFCSGKTFDYKNTRCKTGALGVTALKREDFIRTQHPIYSFAVWGNYAQRLAQMENADAFGNDSPFAFLRKMDFINIIIDVSYQHCFTYVHYVEERTGIVPYRYIKNFTANYINAQGESSERTYSMFVRDLSLDVRVTINPMEEVFLSQGAQKTVEINGIIFRILNLRKADALIEKDIRENRSRRLCTYIGQDKK